MCTAITVLFCALQSAQRSVDGKLARWTVSAATPSAWAAARSPAVMRPAPPACITIITGAAWPSAHLAPTGLRAGAASAWSSAPKCTCLIRTRSSSTGRSACPSARRGTRVPPQTSECCRPKQSCCWRQGLGLTQMLKLGKKWRFH